jgi:hypothetical protein
VVIEGLDIRGMVTINADNVTLKNCKITAGEWAVINITSGSTGVVIQNCEINGLSAEGVRGISGQGTFLSNNIHHTEDGIYLTGSNTLIQDNYIHDLQSNWSGPHYDGIATDGGVSNITIRHNTVINPHGQTSALMLSNYFGSVSNVTVDNNWLEGGGYTVYSDGQFNGGTISGVSFTNNYLVEGQYGYSSIRNNTPVWQGNIEYTGEPVGGGGSGTPTLGAPTIGAFSVDSGTVADGITNDNTLTLTGTATANSSVKVYDGGALLGMVSANNSGAWSFNTALLQDGSHSFTATATSGSTTSPASSSQTVTVDTVAPGAPTIASFSSDTGTVGDGITSDNTLTLTGTAAANSSVKVYDSGALLGTVSANNSGAWSFNTAVLPDGSHSFTAKATDVAGNTGVASAALAVSVMPAASGPSTPAPLSGWADATNTGVPAGVTLLPSGGMIINKAGAIISGLDIHGTVYINAPNVTLMNCRITSSDFYVVKVNASITGAVIKDCDIVGGDSAGEHNGIGGQGTFLRNDISKVDNGIVIQGDNALVQDNYIHDLQAAGEPHYDGIQIDGGISNATIRHNTVINSHDQTSALMINNYFGPVSNVVIDNNKLVGGGYTVYSDGQFAGGPISGVSFTNNILGKGEWGYSYFVNNTPAWQGNTDDAGHAVDTPGIITMGGPEITSFSSDSGVAGDGITNDNSLILKGTAAVFAVVKVYDGTTLIGTATADSTNKWSLTTPTLLDGTHKLTVTETNGSVTSAPSSPVTIKVDTVAPVTTIASNTVNALKQAVIAGTAEANSAVMVFEGATQVGTATADGSGAWTVTTGALANGSHSFAAKATDAAGNAGVASAPSVVNVSSTTTNPPSAPTIATFSNDSGVAGDGITNDNTVTLTGTAVANSTVKVLDGANQIGTANANSDGSWSYITSVLNDAKHILTAKVTDASGQTSAASPALAVTVDTTAPVAPTIAIGSSSATAAGSTNAVNLTGVAEANSNVTIFDAGKQVGTAIAGTNGAWNYATGALASGNHSFTAKAADVAGNVGAMSSALAVNIPSATQTPPVAPSIVSFSKDSGMIGDNLTSDSTLTLAGRAVLNSTVTVFDGAKQIGTATADSSGAWSYTTAALSDGGHNLTAKATDASGQISSASSALAVTIDTHAPNTPTLAAYSLDGKAVGGSTTADDLILRGTAEANSMVSILDGGTQIGTATAGSNGLWSLDTGHLADGSHSFTSTASDAAGNASVPSAAKGVTVDAPASAVGITKMYENSSHIVTIKGTADAFSLIKIYDGTKSVGLVDTAADGTWSYTTASAISKTVHTFSAQEIDKTGHVVGSSGSAILGTTGNDALTSTHGNDLFKGYGGHDTFVFAPNFGQDVIKDFAARGWSHDVVQFSKSVFDNFADVLAHATQSGHDVVIAAGTGDTLTLKNVKLAALDKADFHFS